MKALLLFKQKLKNLYSRMEVLLVPAFKFALAYVYYSGINSFLGYMDILKNTYILLVLSVLCMILPWNVIMYVGFALIIAHCYALNLAVGIFVAVIIVFMLLMFLRFSRGCNIVLVLTELFFGAGASSVLPIGVGLLSDISACLPAGCGIILYYFLKYVVAQEASLASAGMDSQIMLEQVKTLADGLLANREMWLMVVAVAAVSLLVNLVRKASFDYAWRISIVLGGIVYILVMFGGGLVLEMPVNISQLSLTTLAAVLVGLLLEFFVFGGDYTRTERLQYEDDEYYYFVKAVPKSSVPTRSGSVKKIDTPVEDEDEDEDEENLDDTAPINFQDMDYKKKLEESLSDL